ncbi:hypothetical protein PILCRDRAFT_75650 [Piloderma croceum F 1598]|uniref:Protein kinase domain-containing protein n=1 Tax=Piloderma croceum (strain F 1598) TaxID=765440 RepID=A0A0C3BLS6_PILCF|nr:hypothetical protein PILCRDRAFT_75650 [Piloderma croceum F 1598]
MHYSLLILHHPCFLSHSLFSQAFLNPTIRNISIGQPFAIGQHADILLGDLEDDSGGSTKVFLLHSSWTLQKQRPTLGTSGCFESFTGSVLRLRRQVCPTGIETGIKPLLSNPIFLTFCPKSLEVNVDIWCALKHPNVTDFLGLSYEVPFLPALILPYYSKGNSLDFVKRGRNPDLLKLVRIRLGLKYLHEQSPPIIHADIRACNVLVDDTENALLVDFGLVPVLSIPSLTPSDELGPARWQPPEILLPDKDDSLSFTLRSDVFSFAMFAVELLTQKHPFDHHKKDPEVIREIIKGLRPHKPPKSPLVDQLWPILQECWAQAPGDRLDISTICIKCDELT